MKTFMEIDHSGTVMSKQHFLGDFPKSLPIEQAYGHIGTYLEWVVETGLYSEYIEKDAAPQKFRFKGKEISGTVLSEIWNGFLAFEFLNKCGNNFTYYYYTSGLYGDDYKELVGEDLPSVNEVDRTAPGYGKLKARINTRFHEWTKLKNFLKVVPENEVTNCMRLAAGS